MRYHCRTCGTLVVNDALAIFPEPPLCSNCVPFAEGKKIHDRTEHRQRHMELHRALDELFADYIQHHPEQVGFLDMPLQQLMIWSHAQTVDPAELPPKPGHIG
jgi:hypothetical protein